MIEPPRGARVAALNAYWLALNVSNNALDPVVLPILVEGVVAPGVKNSALAVLGAVGLLVAVVWQPIVGAASDRSSRGRLPFLLIGTAAFIACLPLLAFAPSYVGLLVATIALQLASNTIQGPLQALIPDYLAPAAYGAASGVKTVFEVVGTIVGGFAGGQLVSAGHLPLTFAFAGGALLLGAVATILGLRGQRRRASVIAAGHPAHVSLATSLRSLATPALRPYLWWFISRYLASFAFVSIRAFAFYFVQDYLRLPDPAAAVGNLIAAIGLVVGLAAVPFGALVTRERRRGVLAVAFGVAAAVTPLFTLARSPVSLWAIGAVLGVSVAAFQVVGWAMAMDLVPVGQMGRYLGLSNIASAGGSLSARLTGVLIDSLNHWQVGLGYTALFGLDALLFVLAALAILRVAQPAEPGKE